jgi:hypothetical protein
MKIKINKCFIGFENEQTRRQETQRETQIQQQAGGAEKTLQYERSGNERGQSQADRKQIEKQSNKQTKQQNNNKNQTTNTN